MFYDFIVESLIKPSKPESENVETGSESDDEEQNDQGQIEEDQETDEEEDDDYSDVLSGMTLFTRLTLKGLYAIIFFRT